MMILKKEEEYDLALEDGKKIKEVDPSFPLIDKIIAELD